MTKLFFTLTLLCLTFGIACAKDEMSDYDASKLVDDCYSKKVCATQELKMAVVANTLAWEKAEASRYNKNFTLLEVDELVHQWKYMSDQQLVVAKRILRDRKERQK